MRTAMMAKPKRQDPRGWLLVEVAIGGVMASVILDRLLVNIGDAYDKTTVVGREVTANMLAQQAVEQARAIADPTTLTDGTTTIAVPAGLTGTYARTRTVSSGTVTNAGLVQNFKDVQVLVTFPLVNGNTKNIRLETRIYTP